jgi:hypothetical protein
MTTKEFLNSKLNLPLRESTPARDDILNGQMIDWKDMTFITASGRTGYFWRECDGWDANCNPLYSVADACLDPAT